MALPEARGRALLPAEEGRRTYSDPGPTVGKEVCEMPSKTL